jgi:hypothetical protein
MPSATTSVTSIRHSLSLPGLIGSVVEALLQPGRTFSQLLPSWLPPIAADLLLYVAVLGLLHRPNLCLAGLGGQIALGVLFRMVYPGGYRHQGLYLVFVVFLYWLFLESVSRNTLNGVKRRLWSAGYYAGVHGLLLWNALLAPTLLSKDLRLEMSASKAFGDYLSHSEKYREAVILSEPDFIVEALPYYARNQIYIAREHRYSAVVSFTTDAEARLSLGELLAAAQAVKASSGLEVLIVLGHGEFSKYESVVKKYPYNRTFSWTAGELRTFTQSTAQLAEFTSTGDESYRVYALR